MHDPLRATPWTATREGGGRSALYNDLAEELDALLRGETDPVANAANTAAAIYHSLPDLNWVGFYFVRGQELVLGPFQGKPPACASRLQGGGTAAAERRSVLVADVHAFFGHIACDAASRSNSWQSCCWPRPFAGPPGESGGSARRVLAAGASYFATMSPHQRRRCLLPSTKNPSPALNRQTLRTDT